SGPWAIGAFQDGVLLGVVMALRGTGSIYHNPGDGETLNALAEAVMSAASEGRLSLLSGHASQMEPLLPLVAKAGVGRPDRCYFRTLYAGDLRVPGRVDGFGAPRLATGDDIERLI